MNKVLRWCGVGAALAGAVAVEVLMFEVIEGTLNVDVVTWALGVVIITILLVFGVMVLLVRLHDEGDPNGADQEQQDPEPR